MAPAWARSPPVSAWRSRPRAGCGVPRRPSSRVPHAHPRASTDVPAALQRPHPLTPLADRDRRRWSGGRRLAAIGLAAIGLAVAVPLLGAAVTPTAPQLQPLAGGVA